jgi:uncharacterized repeat protein (TIGR03843 family)
MAQDREGTLDESTLSALLERGSLTIEGRLAGSSNGTLLCTAELDGLAVACVYKPVAGERPLWDFPDGTLGHREVAAYRLGRLSTELADDDVPEVLPLTVWRDDGPYGPGACQVWVDVDELEFVEIVAPGAVPTGWRTVLQARDDEGAPLLLVHADDPGLRRMALLDAIANNSDRKGGHILIDVEGALFGVDHGLCFNEDDKVRTVLWGWAGEPLTRDERALVERVAGAVLDDEVLGQHLSRRELLRTAQRAERLLSAGSMPRPSGDWPAIPWPAF